MSNSTQYSVGSIVLVFGLLISFHMAMGGLELKFKLAGVAVGFAVCLAGVLVALPAALRERRIVQERKRQIGGCNGS
jgi:hypothetical protein